MPRRYTSLPTKTSTMPRVYPLPRRLPHREQVLPQLSQMEGFEGFVALGSRHSGRLQGLAFWESEGALRATDEAVVPIREGAAEAVGATVAGVEEFEVSVFEVPG